MTYTRSHEAASSVPPAKQYPCTSAITGVDRSQILKAPSTTCRGQKPSDLLDENTSNERFPQSYIDLNGDILIYLIDDDGGSQKLQI